MTTSSRSERLEETVFHPLRHTSRAWYVWAGFLAVVVVWGIFASAVQLRRGLVATGVPNEVIWGFYITNFVFFIGISPAGTLISAILRVSQAEWRRPVTRMAEGIHGTVIRVGGLHI